MLTDTHCHLFYDDLKNDLKELKWANNVITILDVPLLKNNDDPLAERIKNFKTERSRT